MISQRGMRVKLYAGCHAEPVIFSQDDHNRESYGIRTRSTGYPMPATMGTLVQRHFARY